MLMQWPLEDEDFRNGEGLVCALRVSTWIVIMLPFYFVFSGSCVMSSFSLVGLILIRVDISCWANYIPC